MAFQLRNIPKTRSPVVSMPGEAYGLVEPTSSSMARKAMPAAARY
jgi:hypothetical protein